MIAAASPLAQDVIEKLDGMPMMTLKQVAEALSNLESGNSVPVPIRRGDERFERKIVITSRPEPSYVPFGLRRRSQIQ